MFLKKSPHVLDGKNSHLLLIGMGGLGCPLALALAEGGCTRFTFVDDDVVERSNLHRQILYNDNDVGQKKAERAKANLISMYPDLHIDLKLSRFLPENAEDFLVGVDLVLEGSDNFATKFLVADACFLFKKPVIHAAALRTFGTVLSVSPEGRPCYRCLFEDLPKQGAPNCDEAGVLGPVVGIVAALQADLALSFLRKKKKFGELIQFEGMPGGKAKSLADRGKYQERGQGVDAASGPCLRRRDIEPRENCALCSKHGTISQLLSSRYTTHDSGLCLS